MFFLSLSSFWVLFRAELLYGGGAHIFCGRGVQVLIFLASVGHFLFFPPPRATAPLLHAIKRVASNFTLHSPPHFCSFGFASPKSTARFIVFFTAHKNTLHSHLTPGGKYLFAKNPHIYRFTHLFPFFFSPRQPSIYRFLSFILLIRVCFFFSFVRAGGEKKDLFLPLYIPREPVGAGLDFFRRRGGTLEFDIAVTSAARKEGTRGAT